MPICVSITARHLLNLFGPTPYHKQSSHALMVTHLSRKTQKPVDGVLSASKECVCNLYLLCLLLLDLLFYLTYVFIVDAHSVCLCLNAFFFWCATFSKMPTTKGWVYMMVQLVDVLSFRFAQLTKHARSEPNVRIKTYTENTKMLYWFKVNEFDRVVVVVVVTWLVLLAAWAIRQSAQRVRPAEVNATARSPCKAVRAALMCVFDCLCVCVCKYVRSSIKMLQGADLYDDCYICSRRPDQMRWADRGAIDCAVDGSLCVCGIKCISKFKIFKEVNQTQNEFILL